MILIIQNLGGNTQKMYICELHLCVKMGDQKLHVSRYKLPKYVWFSRSLSVH